MKFVTDSRKCPLCSNEKKSLYLKEGDFKIVKCNSCAFVYLDNIPDESEIYEEYYEKPVRKDDYTKFSSIPLLADIYAINEQRLYYIRKFKLKGNILDIGCGTGLFLKTASHYGFNVYGIDVSQAAVKNAKEEFGIDADKKLISQLDPDHMKFDVITMWHVLEHLIDPVGELLKVRELLKDEGVLFIEVPNLNSIKFRLSNKKWKGGNHPLYHRSYFTPRTLRKILTRAGFGKKERLWVSYELPERNFLYNKTKEIFNIFAMDAFLDYAVKK